MYIKKSLFKFVHHLKLKHSRQMGTYEILNWNNSLIDIVIAVDKNHACTIFAKRMNGTPVYKKIEDTNFYDINFILGHSITVGINKISDEITLSKDCLKRLKENNIPIF